MEWPVTFIVHYRNPYNYTINGVMDHHGAIDVGHGLVWAGAPESSLCCDLRTRTREATWLMCTSVVRSCGLVLRNLPHRHHYNWPESQPASSSDQQLTSFMSNAAATKTPHDMGAAGYARMSAAAAAPAATSLRGSTRGGLAYRSTDRGSISNMDWISEL